MTIKYIENGDLFNSQAQVLVNTVNCKGIMGKGLALQFKQRIPACFKLYKKACKNGTLKPGDVLYVELKNLFEGKDVVHFATKDHWRGKSKLEWVELGLKNLKKECKIRNTKSVAMPPVGCGLGGLQWDKVKPLIEKYFQGADLTLEVYTTATKQYGEFNAAND